MSINRFAQLYALMALMYIDIGYFRIFPQKEVGKKVRSIPLSKVLRSKIAGIWIFSETTYVCVSQTMSERHLLFRQQHEPVSHGATGHRHLQLELGVGVGVEQPVDRIRRAARSARSSGEVRERE